MAVDKDPPRGDTRHDDPVQVWSRQSLRHFRPDHRGRGRRYHWDLQLFLLEREPGWQEHREHDRTARCKPRRITKKP
jgi:hypothetical protein